MREYTIERNTVREPYYDNCEITIKFQVNKDSSIDTLGAVMAQCKQLLTMLRQNDMDITQFRLSKNDSERNDCKPDFRIQSELNSKTAESR